MKIKLPTRIEDGGRWWILPSRAAKLMKRSRLRADRRTWGQIEERLLPVGLNGAAVNYLAEDDVLRCVNAKRNTRHAPEDPENPALGEVATRLGRSTVRVREVIRELGVTELPKLKAKDRLGRGTKITCVPRSLLPKLEAYFASAPEKQLAALRRCAGDAPTDHSASAAASPTPQRRRGRKSVWPTKDIERRCHELRESLGNGWSKVAARRIREEFRIAGFTDAHARTYASRHNHESSTNPQQ
jgi:hypothetical protein